VLITETGGLQCVERRGEPNFIDQCLTIMEEGVRRTFTYRYVRTDLFCQGGYRVYTLNEINSGDIPIEEALRQLESLKRSEWQKGMHRAHDAQDPRLRGTFHKRLSGSPDEAAHDEP
jgi:hypothetical protein